MKNTFFQKGLRLFAAGLFLFILSSCSKTPAESPEEVMRKFKSSATEIESADLDVDLKVTGSDAQDNLNFNTRLGIQFDRQKEADRKAGLEVAMEGAMAAGGRSLSGKLGFEARTIGNAFFLKLNQLESEEESLKQFKPLIEAYRGRWLKLASSLIPPEIQKLQEKDEAALAREEKLKTLFKESQFFSVTREFGTETVNGEKTYHYGIELDPEGLRNYLEAVAAEEGRTLTEKELESSVYLIRSMADLELWIGMKDYYLYKARAKLVTPGTEANRVSLRADLNLEANAYNQAVQIETPDDAEEFDPAALFGIGKAPVTETVPAIPEP